MSAVSGVSNSSMLSWLQPTLSIAPSSTPAAAKPGVSASTSTAAPTGGVPSVGRAHHRHGGGKMAKQVQDAVTSALESSRQSGDTTNPNQVIEDAIAKLLTGSGATAAASGSATASTADADNDDDQASGAAASNASSFEQTLQSFGVSPQQFRSDFLAAVKDAQGGQTNSGSALSGFAKGVMVDEIA